MTLAGSYRYCDDVARREAGNFYPAFRLLPRPQRLSMGALYTFMRIADDLSDEPAPNDVKRRSLAGWRHGMREAMQGRYTHLSHANSHRISIVSARADLQKLVADRLLSQERSGQQFLYRPVTGLRSRLTSAR